MDTIESISAGEFASRRAHDPTIAVVDVRKPGEFAEEHVEGAENFPLDNLNDYMAEISRSEPVYVHCAGGYRSMVANSILKARGFDNVVNVEGGLTAIKKTGVPVLAHTPASH